MSFRSLKKNNNKVKKLNQGNKLVEKRISEYFESINDINDLVKIFRERKLNLKQ